MRTLLAILLGIVLTSGSLAATKPTAGGTWLPPSRTEVLISNVDTHASRIKSNQPGDFTLESAQRYDAAAGDSFEIRVQIKVDLTTWARPELVCYDAAGREIPGPPSQSPSTTTTDWQSFRRVLPALPGTASVRARIRGNGRGQIDVANLEFQPKKIDTYETGALLTQPHPRTRTSVVIESNLNIVNTELLSENDHDGDGKWAVINIDLDRITQRETKGVDWRTNFEDNPNEIYWSDGTVLKSDTVRQDRQPDAKRAPSAITRPRNPTCSMPGTCKGLSGTATSLANRSGFSGPRVLPIGYSAAWVCRPRPWSASSAIH